MNNELNKTKKHLTIIFSIIVFVIILFLGVFYFSFKYLKETSFEKKEFSSFVNMISKSNLDSDLLINRPFKFQDVRFEKGKKILENTKDENLNKFPNLFRPKNFINLVLIDSNKKIVTSDTKDEIDTNIIENTLNLNNYGYISQKKGILSTKLDIESGKYSLILFKKTRYNLDDYLTDILGFIFISILFSTIVYFIGYKFIDRALKPVEENLKDMKDFVHNAGHELKTPISVIDSNIQLVLDTKKYDEDMINEMKQEVLRINSLIDSLINLNDISGNKINEIINLREIIEGIQKENKQKIRGKNIEIKINIPKNTQIKANKDYFYIFLSNIIGNAIKYNINYGKIDIFYKKNELIISDSGIGIEENEKDKIFDRFYKTDKSRNSEGFGIGLSLVKKIANMYNWKISIGSEIGNGTVFKIKF